MTKEIYGKKLFFCKCVLIFSAIRIIMFMTKLADRQQSKGGKLMMGTAFRVYPQMKTMGEVSFLEGVLFARRLPGRRDDPSPFSFL